MIGNLLDNAAEAAPDRPLRVRVVSDVDWLTISVRDQGPGFAPEMLAHFGKPYHSSKGRPGSGLGLFLSVNVARTLGGTHRGAQSARRRRRGGGHAAAGGADERGRESRWSSQTERHLLIVEDDDAFARTLARSFERRGYSVTRAASLAEVEALLPHSRADLRGGRPEARRRQLRAWPACRRCTRSARRC